MCLATAVAVLAQPATLGHSAKLAVAELTAVMPAKLTVTSPAFRDGADIPWENTQYRGNVFPGLAWTAGPAGTQSYVVVVQGELNAASTSIHLVVFNIPAGVTKLDAGMTTAPAGSTYGVNVHGLNEPYNGPHTHTAEKHAYHYQVLALDTVLGVDPKVDYGPMSSAIKGHVLASGDLVGLSAKDPQAK
jgi:para-nitrobenzyl esterase